jgi:hypothetical protein
MDNILKNDLPILILCSYEPEEIALLFMERLNYYLDDELSTDENRVYTYKYNDEEHIIVVYRGTYRCKDWFTDFLCIFGLSNLSCRYRRSIELIDDILIKYGDNINIHTVGHSLGGYLSEYSGANGYKITYNKLVSICDINKTIDNKTYNIREHDDIVSVLQLTQHDVNLETINILTKRTVKK